MPTITYITKNFSPVHAAMIAHANRLIAEYQQMGITVTLRQVYYRIVAGDLFPDDRTWAWTGKKWVRDPSGTKNATPNYKWLGDILNDGRLAGKIDWEAMEDRTRNLVKNSHWGSPADIIEACADSYMIDRWADQPNRIEVWAEKEALSSVFEPVCAELDVAYFACRGYTSSSELWRAAMRLVRYCKAGQRPLIIHLGDHDPSGVDMSRDIVDRVRLLMGETHGSKLDVDRIALNMDQVEQYEPPPNPAKMTDSRAEKYVEAYGNESWELDALDPPVLIQLVRDNINKYCRKSLMKAKQQQEAEEKATLRKASDQWESVVEFLD